MKALTLTQPWAQLVAIGGKRIETRSWNTFYRGPLAIHAAKGFPKEAHQICFGDHFREQLGNFVNLEEGIAGDHEFPLGAIIAVCELVHVVKIDWRAASSSTKFFTYKGLQWSLGKRERAFGNYSIGRYMWLLDNVEILYEPIPAKGALGLWEFDGDLSIYCSQGYDMNEVDHGKNDS